MSLRTLSRAPNRLTVLAFVALLALLSFQVVRLVLTVLSPVGSQGVAPLLGAFGIGSVYDVAFVVECCALASVCLLLGPDRLMRTRVVRALGVLAVVLAVGAMLFSAISELVFWDEFEVRFNFIAVDYLIYTHEVIDNIRESYPMPAIFGGIVALAFALLWPFRRWIWRGLGAPVTFRARAVTTTALGVASFAAVLGLGQGLRQWSKDNYLVELASNGPYQFVAAFRNNTLDFPSFYATEDSAVLGPLLKREVVAATDALHDGSRPASAARASGAFDLRRTVRSSRPEQRLSVILVSVESLSADFLGRYGNTQGLTPFLDRLAEESLTFDRFYATGTRTTRGLEAITLAIPPTPGRSIVKRPDNAGMFSLGSVFGARGYDVAFLYGGRGYFDNMNAFFGGNGYRVVDRADLTPREVTFENAWGVCDEDLYGRALAEADAAHARGTPFFFHVMTTSNHRPYTFPERGLGVVSGAGREAVVRYTDYALETLVESARSRGWFDDTLFVILADHCASSAGRTGLPVEKYHIPALIYAPEHVPALSVARLASQIDLAPTLLALLGFQYESCFFGRDILADDFEERALIGNYQKLGLLAGERLAILSPRKELDVVEAAFTSPVIRAADGSDPLVLRALAYYQGADSLLRDGLLRRSNLSTP